MSRYEETPGIAETVPAGGAVHFTFRSSFVLAQCVGVEVAYQVGASLLVSSVKVGESEQLLGDGVPAEFFRSGVLVCEPQAADIILTVTITNHGSDPVDAGVCAAFVEIPDLIAHAGKVWS